MGDQPYPPRYCDFQRAAPGGDIGDGDDVRQKKVIALAREFLTEPLPSAWQRLQTLKVFKSIPYEWLQNRTQKLTAFKNHRLGPTKALGEVITSLRDSGILRDVSSKQLQDDFSYYGRAYVIDVTGKKVKHIMEEAIDRANEKTAARNAGNELPQVER